MLWDIYKNPLISQFLLNCLFAQCSKEILHFCAQFSIITVKTRCNKEIIVAILCGKITKFCIEFFLVDFLRNIINSIEN